MPYQDCFTLMGIGSVFFLLGLGLILWGKREERGYYSSIAARPDVREFLEHSPENPGPEGSKVGGWIASAIGLLTLAMGIGFWLWG